MESTIFDFIKNTVLYDVDKTVSEKKDHNRRDFVMKLQQFTGPVQAKGLEDTAFYRYQPPHFSQRSRRSTSAFRSIAFRVSRPQSKTSKKLAAHHDRDRHPRP